MSLDIDELPNFTSYNDILLRSNITNNVYYLNTADDISGYVFEITAFDTSAVLGVSPSFDTNIQYGVGLEDVSAVAMLDVSLSDFNSLFSFKSDSDDIDDLSINDLKFGINSNALNIFSNIPFSNAVVVSGNINTFYQNQQIKKDYVRNLAYQITGGYSAADIFTNEEALATGVSNLDPSFQSSFNTIVGDLIDLSFVSIEDFGTSTNPSVLKAALGLFTLNLNEGSERTNQILSDIQTESTNNSIPTSVGPITVPIRFHVGDRIAIRLVYKNQNTVFSGNNTTLEPRSYKILLNLV